VRQEDKEVDGPDLERAEERKRESELVEEKDDELYDLDGLPETSHDVKRGAEVMTVMRAILDEDNVNVNELKLPKRQLVALEAFKTAVDGKDARLSRFVFAEDRRTLLEQSLAVLQPELASMEGLGKPFEELIASVSSLREKLNVLEDSEEELVEGRHLDYIPGETDTDDKPDETDESADLDADPEPKPKPKQPALAKPKPPIVQDTDMSLDGPERPVPPKPETSLGDPKEIAAGRRTDG
jgi:hypothetical protein